MNNAELITRACTYHFHCSSFLEYIHVVGECLEERRVFLDRVGELGVKVRAGNVQYLAVDVISVVFYREKVVEHGETVRRLEHVNHSLFGLEERMNARI